MGSQLYMEIRTHRCARHRALSSNGASTEPSMAITELASIECDLVLGPN